MNHATWRICAAASLLCALMGTRTIDAHELVSSDGQYQWSPQRAAHMPNDPVFQPGRIPPPAQYVVVLPNRWAIQQQIHICFNGGDSALRKRILDAAAVWFTHANLQVVSGGPAGITCKPQDRSEIRIGFREPGYWSYIGTDGLGQDLIQNNLSSMNFQGFDVAPPPEPHFTGIVLHEFGHALGFHHEHQSPGEGCDAEYDWDKLYAYYQKSYGWDKAMVDQNVRQLNANRSAYDWSTPDPQSIMVYASDPQFLKNGTHSKCYFQENDVLSNLDIAGVEKTYPRAQVALTLKAQASNLSYALQSEIPSDLRLALKKQLDLTKAQIQKINP